MSSYLDWRDLLDEEPVKAEPSSAAPPPVTPGPAPTADVLPPELKALLAEKERLEAELKALSGQAPAPKVDERQQRCFPVKVHTKESRIEDRRLQRHDEHLALLAQKARERALAARRGEERRQEEQEALLAEARRRKLARRIAELQAAEAEARAQAEADLKQRWAELRRAATAAHAAQVRQEEAWHEERTAQVATAALTRLRHQQQAEALTAARAEAARATRILAAQQLVVARRREAQLTERRLDTRHKTGQRP